MTTARDLSALAARWPSQVPGGINSSVSLLRRRDAAGPTLLTLSAGSAVLFPSTSASAGIAVSRCSPCRLAATIQIASSGDSVRAAAWKADTRHRKYARIASGGRTEIDRFRVRAVDYGRATIASPRRSSARPALTTYPTPARLLSGRGSLFEVRA